MSLLQDVRGSSDLLRNLTLREVRGRYKRTALGNAWSLINPIATMVIYTLVFGLLLRVQVPPGQNSGLDVFALWLMCGLIPWTFLSSAVSSGLESIVGNANLVMKVYFPREVLVGASVLALDVTFLIELGVLVVALLLFGSMVLPWLPLVLVLVVLLTAFVLGLALMLSVANVYFRDTRHFTNIALQVWFYLTPILYPISYVQQAEDEVRSRFGYDVPLERIFSLNPMEHFTSAFRLMLYDNAAPRLSDFAWCLAWAVFSLTAGWMIFRRRSSRMAEEL